MNKAEKLKTISMLVFIIAVSGMMGCSSSHHAGYVSRFHEESAISHIYEIIEFYEASGISIVDSRIMEFEKVAEFDQIISDSIELWFLDFHLKLEDDQNIWLDATIEDDWIIHSNETRVYLIFHSASEGTKYIGHIPFGIYLHSNFDSIWGKEIAVRQTLETLEILSEVTFLGNRFIVYFLSGGLILSQPSIQGEYGIWAVERWWLDNSFDFDTGKLILNHASPLSQEKTMHEYFNKLQLEVSNGYELWRLEPYEVARRFIDDNFSANYQIYAYEKHVIDLGV